MAGISGFDPEGFAAEGFDPEDFDPRHLPAGFLDDPYPFYHDLRRVAPVHRCPDGSLFLTRHADVSDVYRSRTTSSDKRVMFRPTLGDGSAYTHHTTSLVFNDPPYHTRVRQAIQGALIPRALRALAPSLEALVESLLDRAEEIDAREEKFDLIEDFAAAIPIEVIGNLLGVPRDEREPLRGWSLAILSALEPTIDNATLKAANQAVDEFSDYLAGLIAARREKLVLDGSDPLSLLIATDPDHPLTEMELIHNAIFLLNAGHETTTNLIGNGVMALLANPKEHRRLIEDPAMIDSAIEEFLRYESSNQLGNRLTTEEMAIGDVTVAANTMLTLCIGAANRDPAEFPDPDRLDLARRPNRHLAFGLGIHACAGMQLARMEGRAAIAGITRRFPGLRAAGPHKRGNRARFRGLLTFPVTAR